MYLSLSPYTGSLSNFVFIKLLTLIESFIFDLENLCLNSLNFFLIFSVLDLEKIIFVFVSSKFLSLSFSDSEKSLYIREKSPNQRKVATSGKSLEIREKSLHQEKSLYQRKVSKSEKSLKNTKLIMLIPSKPNDIRLLLLLSLLKHSLNRHHCQIHYQIYQMNLDLYHH